MLRAIQRHRRGTKLGMGGDLQRAQRGAGLRQRERRALPASSNARPAQNLPWTWPQALLGLAALLALLVLGGCASTLAPAVGWQRDRAELAQRGPPPSCLLGSGAQTPDEAVALAASSPRGCGAGLEAQLEGARRAGTPRQRAGLLAWARRGLRAPKRWAELGLDEAQAWDEAGDPRRAWLVALDVWRGLAGWEQAPSPAAWVDLRHRAWRRLSQRAALDEAHAPLGVAQEAEHLLALLRLGRKAQAQEVIARWREAGLWDDELDGGLLAQAGSLGKPHRKRARPDHAQGLACSDAMTPLARLVEGERALTLAALDPAQGLDALEALLARGGELTDDARSRWAWRAAWLALWVGQEERAQVHIHKLLDDRAATRPWGAEGAWLKALPLLTRGDWEGARPWLETSAQRSSGPWREEALALAATSPEARARYWLMRADLAQGRHDDARARLAALAHHHPLSLYHLIGVHALGHALGVRPEPLRVPSWAGDPRALRAAPDRWIAGWLEAGALPQAERAAAEQRLYAPPTSPARVALWAESERLRGQRSSPLWWAWLSPSDARDLLWAEQAPFDEPDPGELWARIREQAAPSGLDPLLILALIGQESGFRTDKCSFSGACGLMQIKPMAAKTVQMGDDPEGGEPPLVEGDNLAVGVRLLARLREKADPRPLLALAAWNAGPGAVRRWMEARAPMEGDLWLEWMPDRRTRAWIIGILNRYSLYAAWLQGGKTRDPAR